MKTQVLVAALAGIASANPVSKRQEETDFGSGLSDLSGALQGDGFGLGGTTSNDLESGSCEDVTFIFARGSTEPGNMGMTVGPATCEALQDDLDSVACQGVGGDYTASLMTNALPKNTDDDSISEAVGLFEMAAEKCPETQIVAGGYSQGTAVISNAIQELDSAIQDQIKGVVLYGFTRNLQDRGEIPGFPESKTEVYCAVGDMVCSGTLIITLSHFTYNINVREAARFLTGQVS